jgi:hypothetical protein
MNTKTVTFLFLLLALGLVLFAYGALNRGTAEGVVRATERYVGSGHADRTARAFTYWNDNDPPLIPALCARCHGTPGFLAYLGEDDLHAGLVNRGAPAGTPVTCLACHNPTAHRLAEVDFTSTVRFPPVGSEAVCLACHQTRESTLSILVTLRGRADDTVAPGLSFISPHYNFAASTQLGAVAASGYEYPDRQYAGYFRHAASAETCTDCHNPHGLAVTPQKCAVCHLNVVGRDHFRAIRTQRADYDGDGDAAEGIYGEIGTLQAQLLGAIQAYAHRVTGTPIAWADQFPYFCVDADANGVADAAECTPGNRYNAWTPRLLKAAYNYQFAAKDPGGYVHNARYVIQLLHDSLADLTPQAGLPDPKLSRP